MAGTDRFINTEQTADIVPTILNRRNAEVSSRATVHFQLCLRADAAHVRLETDPPALRKFTTCRPDLAGGVGVHFAA